ncbi:MAG: aspartate aminotransferase family protein [Flavobacteriales bacterium]|nr:aspartate aminotransferase family protein [Flavobacteriales bacterium]
MENNTISTSKGASLMDRRKAVVPNGIGIFNTATAVTAKNATIIDADGNELIDFAGGIGVVNSGHCPDSIVAAISEQASKMIHTCFNVATYEPYLNLAEKLASILPHGDHTKVMITNTGAESVENAIKIARQATGREGIICFSEAFHGRSMMAMSLTFKEAYKTGCGPFAPGIHRFPFPNYYKNGNGKSVAEFGVEALADFKSRLDTEVDKNNIAAVILELVQGEGGFTVAPQEYVEGLREICTEHGIMLIFDEVQAGFGRTGKWASHHHYNVTPDLSTYAKSMGSGMPIGAVVGRAEVMDGAKPGTIGGTYLGNPVCCAASLATIKFMEDNDINGKGVEVGNIVKASFDAMKAKYSVIGDVRGLGAMLAFELVKDGDKNEPNGELCGNLVRACAARGLIMLSAGTFGNIVRVLSPLTIETALLEKGLNIIDEELAKLA